MVACLQEIPLFPGYYVSHEGDVYRDAPRGMTKLSTSITRQGLSKVVLYKQNRAHTRGVALLVAEAFVWNNWDPQIYNTPIHLDHNLTNNHSDNLDWRPRWFALRYQRQYWFANYHESHVPVVEVHTERMYDTIQQACQEHGLLFIDVFESCLHGTDVFPTRKVFSFVN